MLNLHRSATDRSRNYSTSTSDFGSVLSTSMIFTSRLDMNRMPGSSVLTSDEETAVNTEFNRDPSRSRHLAVIDDDPLEEIEMGVMR